MLLLFSCFFVVVLVFVFTMQDKGFFPVWSETKQQSDACCWETNKIMFLRIFDLPLYPPHPRHPPIPTPGEEYDLVKRTLSDRITFASER